MQGVALGSQYCNAKAARDFLTSMAHVVRMRIVAAARSTPCLGLMIDESTDIAHTSQMVLYLRLMVDATYQTVFWRIVSVPDATADGLVSLLTETFHDDEIPTSNVCSFASDGASVLTGCEAGVAVQLVNSWNVYMLVCHCIAHRHALAVLDASKDNDVAEFVDLGLHSILNYFSHSPKRRCHLRALQEKLQVATLSVLGMVVTR
jgi:hypothetical protein